MRINRPALITMSVVVLFAAFIIVFLVYKKAFFIAGYEKEHSLHSPVFSRDGRTVYYLSRKTAGLALGPGIENFTPPAKVLLFSDMLTLQSADVMTGSIKELAAWKIPHGRKIEEHYRNRVFGFPSTSLSWTADGRLEYLFGLDLFPDAVPYIRETEWLKGSWDPRTGTSREEVVWKKAALTPAPWPDEILHGDSEVISYQNKAVLLHNGKTGSIATLVASDTADLKQLLSHIRIEEHSRRADIEKRTLLRETREKLIAKLVAEGHSEGDVLLKASDELEKQGFYPKSPKIKAARVHAAGREHETFAISADEFRFGLFQDIEKAIKNEGQEINFWGNYVRHNDFDTSEKLNAYLAAGNRSFYVSTGGKHYLMTVTR